MSEATVSKAGGEWTGAEAMGEGLMSAGMVREEMVSKGISGTSTPVFWPELLMQQHLTSSPHVKTCLGFFLKI